eukprot:jgi/Bigna1/91617/estExt_fgenesh1_pg.C_1090026
MATNRQGVVVSTLRWNLKKHGARGKAFLLEVDVSLSDPYDCSIPMQPEPPEIATDQKLCIMILGSWVARVTEGSSVNVDLLCLCVHGNGTHSECIGHITRDRITIQQIGWRPDFLPALLISIRPLRFRDCCKEEEETYSSKSNGDDWVLSRAAIKRAIHACTSGLRWWSKDHDCVQALLVRTIPPLDNEDKTVLPKDETARRSHCWSNTNPPYFTKEAAEFIASMSSLRTLAVDLPSVDREDDGGALIAHRAIFSHLPDGEISKDKKEQESIGEKEEEDDDEGKTKAELVTRKLSSSSSLEKDDLSLKNMGCQQRRLITESCSFPSPETMEDGFCCLSLQLAPIENTDAVPSRPLLYRAVETRATAV